MFSYIYMEIRRSRARNRRKTSIQIFRSSWLTSKNFRRSGSVREVHRAVQLPRTGRERPHCGEGAVRHRTQQGTPT